MSRLHPEESVDNTQKENVEATREPALPGIPPAVPRGTTADKSSELGQQFPEKYRSSVRTFTRRSARAPEKHERLLREYPDFLVDAPGDDINLDPAWRFNAATVFGSSRAGHPLIVEIGTGVGDQIAAASQDFPQINFLGLEVWRPGIARTLAKVLRHARPSQASALPSAQTTQQAVSTTGSRGALPENVRILESDAVLAVEQAFAPASIAQLWVFFPDPWRKARHHKRRLVQEKFLLTAAKIVAPGGWLRIATDWEDYAQSMAQIIALPAVQSRWHNPYSHRIAPPYGDDRPARGFAPRYAGRVLTKFEMRGQKEERIIRDIALQRRDD